jgi:Ca2+-binding EF-hand superfamily protein
MPLYRVQAEFEQIRESYRAQFQSFDDDNSGSISIQELGRLMAALGEAPTKKASHEA